MFLKMTSRPDLVLTVFSIVILSAVYFANGERCRTTGGNCIRSCVGTPDGDYQSCHGCSVFATCTAEVITNDRPCNPPTLKWDDDKQSCEYNSTTCHCRPYHTTVRPTTKITTEPGTTSTHKGTTEIVTTSDDHTAVTHTRTPHSTTKSSSAVSTLLCHLSRRSCALGIFALAFIYVAM